MGAGANDRRVKAADRLDDMREQLTRWKQVYTKYDTHKRADKMIAELTKLINEVEE